MNPLDKIEPKTEMFESIKKLHLFMQKMEKKPF